MTTNSTQVASSFRTEKWDFFFFKYQDRHRNNSHIRSVSARLRNGMTSVLGPKWACRKKNCLQITTHYQTVIMACQLPVGDNSVAIRDSDHERSRIASMSLVIRSLYPQFSNLQPFPSWLIQFSIVREPIRGQQILAWLLFKDWHTIYYHFLTKGRAQNWSLLNKSWCRFIFWSPGRFVVSRTTTREFGTKKRFTLKTYLLVRLKKIIEILQWPLSNRYMACGMISKFFQSAQTFSKLHHITSKSRLMRKKGLTNGLHTTELPTSPPTKSNQTRQPHSPLWTKPSVPFSR